MPNTDAVRQGGEMNSFTGHGLERTEQHLTAVIQADPAQPDGWLERARCRSAAGDPGGALADATEFCRLAPERGYQVAGLLASAIEGRLLRG